MKGLKVNNKIDSNGNKLARTNNIPVTFDLAKKI